MARRLWLVVVSCWVSAGANHNGANIHHHHNALLIAGAVSRLPTKGGNGQFISVDSLYDSSRAYSSIKVCANSVLKHIVRNNPVPTDVFLHTWSFDLEPQFRQLYNLTASAFEHNRPYEAQMKHLFPEYSWPEISYTISVQRVVRSHGRP